MQVLLVTDKMQQHEEVMIAYMKAGFQITATSSVKVAETFCRYGAVDLLILAEKLEGKLTHGTALLAEHKNPAIATILLTDRTDDSAGEVFDLIPSVHSCVGTKVPGDLIMKLGRASVESLAQLQIDLFVSSQDKAQAVSNQPAPAEKTVLDPVAPKFGPATPEALRKLSLADAA